jgi:hypothetical protein
MGKLTLVREQLNAKRAARDAAARARAQEIESQKLDEELISRMKAAILSGIKETDLSPVMQAIVDNRVTIPEVNMQPIVDAVRQAVLSMRDVVAAESKSLKNSMPVPSKTDLSPVLNDLQWVKTYLALKPDPKIPEIVPPPKVKWLDVERNREGFISRVVPEYF